MFITFIKNFVPQSFLNILKRLINLNFKYYGLYLIDKKVEKYLSYRNGFYVELGANDGVAQSNTLYFEKYKGWTGVLIEPTPNNFLKCLENRSPKNHFFFNACTSFDYDSKYVEIAFSGLMSSPLNLESDISNPLEHAMLGKKFLKPTDKVFTFGALSKTLNQILIDSAAPAFIDFLSLDVMGAEIEVLKGIDHKAFRFKYICVECRDFIKISEFLYANKYILVEQLSPLNFLFADNSISL